MAANCDAVAEDIIRRIINISDDVAEIEVGKEKLRQVAIERGAGFSIEVAKGNVRGKVEVGKEVKAELTGMTYELEIGEFLALSESKRARMPVREVEVWRKGARPKVTVRL